MATHDVTNSQNLQALIDFIQNHDATKNQLQYVQVGRFVLLERATLKPTPP
jgi:hypothetical protein